MLDDVYVKGVSIFRDHDRLEILMDIGKCHLRGHKAQPPSDSKTVRIDREYLPLQRVHQDTFRRFDADARQCRQVTHGFFVRHRFQRVKRGPPEIRDRPFEDRLHPRRFLSTEASILYDGFQTPEV